MILKDGTDYEVQTEDILRWQKTYKDIDVYLELDKMESWCIDYPCLLYTSDAADE